MIGYLNAFRKGISVEEIEDLDVWNDSFRVLPEGKTSEPGRMRVDRTPYMREILKACSVSSRTKHIVCMKGTQIGWSTAIESFFGQRIHRSPCPMMYVGCSLSFSERWSKDRFQPMVDNTPVLKNLISDQSKRDGGNTILLKQFPGGSLSILGANSADGFRGVSIKLIAKDEVDSYPDDVGGEGDIHSLLRKRVSSYYDYKILEGSTPTEKHFSRIELAFLNGTQEYYYVPCVLCGFEQIIKFENIKFKDEHGNKNHKLAKLECIECKKFMDEGDKTQLLANGRWIAHNKDADPDECRSFHISSLYSPVGWMSWEDAAKEFIEAKGSPLKMRAFKNTILGETYEVESISADDVSSRREEYGGVLPKKVMVLTCAVDVQNNRLEALVCGWGLGEEMWTIEQEIFHGLPSDMYVWDQLNKYLKKSFKHPNGFDLKIVSTCVDTAGGFEKQAYKFCKGKLGRRIHAIKGANTQGAPLVSRPRTSNIGKVSLFMVGGDTAKRTFFANLSNKQYGTAGYCHFSNTHDDEFFLQITSEKLVSVEKNGKYKRQWKKTRDRNEALDLIVYNMAALELLNPNWSKIAESFSIDEPEETEEAENIEENQKQKAEVVIKKEPETKKIVTKKEEKPLVKSERDQKNERAKAFLAQQRAKRR